MFKVTFKDGATVTGAYGKLGNPILVFNDVPNMHGTHTFAAEQLITSAYEGDVFCFGSGFDDGIAGDYTVSKEAVQEIARLISANYDQRNGYFEVVFKNTRGLPF